MISHRLPPGIPGIDYPKLDGLALRHNEGKLDWSLLPVAATEEELRVWMNGAQKYAPHNWRKGQPQSVLLACAFRHLTALLRGEDLDSESGLHHAAHVRCNMAMLIEQRERQDLDDRYKP